MMLILFFILILNVVAIALTYYCLSGINNKGKLIFIAIGIALVYILTSFVYWISTKGISLKEVSDIGKNVITFIFVPINGIITLPIIAKSYNKYKIGSLASDKLRNRVIVIAILLIIVLMIECSYFKDIQNGVIELVEKNYKENSQMVQNVVENNAIIDDANNTLTNQIQNHIGVENSNIIENGTKNEVVY